LVEFLGEFFEPFLGELLDEPFGDDRDACGIETVPLGARSHRRGQNVTRVGLEITAAMGHHLYTSDNHHEQALLPLRGDELRQEHRLIAGRL